MKLCKQTDFSLMWRWAAWWYSVILQYYLLHALHMLAEWRLLGEEPSGSPAGSAVGCFSLWLVASLWRQDRRWRPTPTHPPPFMPIRSFDHRPHYSSQDAIDVQVGTYNVPTNQLLGCWAPLGPPTPIPSPVNPPNIIDLYSSTKLVSFGLSFKKTFEFYFYFGVK